MPTIYELASWVILAQADGGGVVDGADAANKPPANPLQSCGGMMIPMAMIMVLFYFMMIRPQQKERTKMRELLDNMKKNDRVVTAGGIVGTVVNVAKDSPYVTLRIDDKTETRMKIKRTSIIGFEADDESAAGDKPKDKQGDEK